MFRYEIVIYESHSIGQQFALTEMAYVIARFMQSFERIENREGGKHPVMRSDIVLVPESGPLIGLIPKTGKK